jgi:hypothetical protein
MSHEETAKRLLPCLCGPEERQQRGGHDDGCPAYYRFAVAAALAERDVETEYTGMSIPEHIAQLRAKLAEAERNANNAYLMSQNLQGIVTILEAERDAAKTDNFDLEENFLQAKAERDAAYVRGLERAQEIAAQHRYVIADAIADEIKKAG